MQRKTNVTNEIQRIFSRRVALELRNRGFKIIKTEVNFKRPQFDVYCFENSEELQLAIRDMPTK